jgi:hypothetical protein
MFSGCIFDGPLSVAPDPDGGADPDRWILDLGGEGVADRAIDDPVGGSDHVQQPIPKQFFKVLVWRQHGELQVEAFILTQEGWLAKLQPEVWELAPPRPLPEQLLVYQVALHDVERLTNLDFGLASRRALTDSIVAPRLITSLDDIRH